jgi:hypothetical protein
MARNHRKVSSPLPFFNRDQSVDVEWDIRVDSATAAKSASLVHTLDFISKTTYFIDIDPVRPRNWYDLSRMVNEVLQNLKHFVLPEHIDLTALATCQSLHTLSLKRTSVSDVSALASCQSLSVLNLSET